MGMQSRMPRAFNFDIQLTEMVKLRRAAYRCDGDTHELGRSLHDARSPWPITYYGADYQSRPGLTRQLVPPGMRYGNDPEVMYEYGTYTNHAKLGGI